METNLSTEMVRVIIDALSHCVSTGHQSIHHNGHGYYVDTQDALDLFEELQRTNPTSTKASSLLGALMEVKARLHRTKPEMPQTLNLRVGESEQKA
jgi:hypothetical protein